MLLYVMKHNICTPESNSNNGKSFESPYLWDFHFSVFPKCSQDSLFGLVKAVRNLILDAIVVRLQIILEPMLKSIDRELALVIYVREVTKEIVDLTYDYAERTYLYIVGNR